MIPAERTVYINAADPEQAQAVRWAALGYEIVNAPRPLPGEESWICDFRHGTIYAACLAPSDRMREEWRDLDAWPVLIVTDEQIRGFVRDHMAGEIDEADALETWGGWPELARAAGWPYQGKE